MDFSPRGFQRNSERPATQQPAGTTQVPVTGGDKESRTLLSFKDGKLLQVLSVVLLASITVLLVALAIGAYTSKEPVSGEAARVAEDRYQAVFLNGGQVYFGRIASLNNEYIDLQDVYYLNVADQNVQTGADNAQDNVALVKLGCELHAPQDQMFINREHVTFWENLKTDGQVANAIKQWQDQNPNGQTCNKPAEQQSQDTAAPDTSAPNDETDGNTTQTP